VPSAALPNEAAAAVEGGAVVPGAVVGAAVVTAELVAAGLGVLEPHAAANRPSVTEIVATPTVVRDRMVPPRW
jgi:hypothetical protein